MVDPHRPPVVADRDPVLLRDNWTFSFVDGPDAGVEQPVTVPHTFNAVDGATGDPTYRRGATRYRREIDPITSNESRTALVFEGVNSIAEVYVGGEFVGRHRGGYTGFTLDITEALRVARGAARDDGPVELLVIADNSQHPDVPPLSADFTFYGGIYRPVWLIIVPGLHIDLADHGGPGVRVDTADDGSVTAFDVSVGVANPGPAPEQAIVSAVVSTPDGAELGRIDIQPRIEPGRGTLALPPIRLDAVRRWRPADPYRHLVTVTVGTESNDRTDQVTLPVGVRRIGLRDGTVTVDDEPVRALGSCRHQDWIGRGNALSDADHRGDLQLLADLGMGVVRLAHYPQADVVLDEADRLGLLIWEEIPIVNEITLSEEFSATGIQMQAEMIAQHRHHPSVALWGYMNEVLIREPDHIDRDEYHRGVLGLAAELEQQSRALDPSRLTVMACNQLDNGGVYDEIGLTELPMIVGWNIYAGWYFGQFDEAGAFLDAQHAAHPDRALWLSEFGADCIPERHAVDPIAPDGSMEWAMLFHESYLRQLKARPWLTGATTWVGFDFGVAGRGDPRPGANTKGLYTAERAAKDTAFLYQANLGPDPVLHLCETDWTVRPAGNHTLVTYTNLDSIVLTVDGGSTTLEPDEIGVVRLPIHFEPGRHAITVSSAGPAAERLVTTLTLDCHPV